jgi:hypothetical protein
MKPFNYQQDFKQLDFRQHPELYQVGRGEQGVLMVEPYKSEILPHWRKYGADGKELPRTVEKEKAAAAAVFKACWDRLRADNDYLARKKAHQQKYG